MRRQHHVSGAKRWSAAMVGVLTLCWAGLTIGPLHSDDKKPADAPKNKKDSLEEFAKQFKLQLAASAPPAWKTRTDQQGDALPTGVVARLGTARYRHGSSITCVAYSTDGKLLASGGLDNKIRLFDATSGKEVRQLEGHQKSTFVMPKKPGLADFAAPVDVPGPITAMAFSPDNKILASGGWDDMVRLWDTATGNLVRRLDAHQSNVSTVVFSRDGKLLASRGGLDSVVRLWDPATGKELRKFENLSRRSAAVVFSADSKTVAVGDARVISLRDVVSGKETGQFKQPGCLCLGYSPDGKLLAAGGRDGTLRLWDLATGNELRRCAIPKKEPPDQLAFSPDSKYLAAAVKENNALVFDVATGKPAHVLGHYWPDSVAYAPDGKTLATGGEPSAIRLWDTATGKELALEQAGHQAAVTHVAVSADGKTLATGGDNLRLWALGGAGGKAVRRIEVPGRYVEALAVSPDGKTVATGGRDKTVRLWDAESGRQIESFKHEGTLRAVAFSPDGKTLASGDLQLNLRLWDLAARKEIHKIRIPASFTDRLSLAFSPDSKILACGGALNADFPRGIPSTDPLSISLPDKGYPVLLWDASTAKEIGRLEGLTSRIRSIAFSPDGKVLAAASSDGRISLWDVNSRKEQLSILAHPDNVDSSFRSSPSLLFEPDGKMLVSVSTDQTIRLWDTVTGKERGRLSAPTRFFAVALAADGKLLLTGHADGSALVWDPAYLASAKPPGKRNFSIGHIDLR